MRHQASLNVTLSNIFHTAPIIAVSPSGIPYKAKCVTFWLFFKYSQYQSQCTKLQLFTILGQGFKTELLQAVNPC